MPASNPTLRIRIMPAKSIANGYKKTRLRKFNAHKDTSKSGCHLTSVTWPVPTLLYIYHMAYLGLVRWQNLFFVALTQTLFYYTVLKPFLALYHLAPSLNDVQFILLVFSTCLVTAAGYVINDYFDVNADVINKPGKIFIHTVIHRRDAIKLHFILNIVAFLLGIYLAYSVKQWKLAIINPGVAGVLWFYTTNLKRLPALGNLTIGLLTAMVLWVVCLYDNNVWRPVTELQIAVAPAVKTVLFGYMIFAFITTVIREIVKDMEDIEGDKKTGCKTLPVVLGLRETGFLTLFLVLLVLFLLGYIQFFQAAQLNQAFYLPLVYGLFFISLPLVYLVIRLVTATQKSDYAHMSMVIKAVMVFGILSMLVLYYQKFGNGTASLF